MSEPTRKGANSFFKIHDHLRMLNDIIPANEGILYRFLVNARLEIDEDSGEILPRRGMSAREWLQLVSKIKRSTSFREASSKAGKLGLIENQRVYSQGERQKGGDQVKLTRGKWDELTAIFIERKKLNENQNAGGRIPETGIQQNASGIPETGIQRDSETGIQHNKESTAIVTARRARPTGALLGNTAEGSLPVASATASGDSSPLPPSAPELPAQLTSVELQGQQLGVAWVEVGQVPPHHARAIWQDQFGKVHFVFNKAGRAFYGSLLAESFEAADIHQALMTCGAALQDPRKTHWRKAGSPEAVVRQWCTYAKRDRLAVRGKANGHYAPKGAAEPPRSFGGWE